MRRLLLLVTLVGALLLLEGCVMVPHHEHWNGSFLAFPFFAFPFGLFGLALYLLPTIVVVARGKKDVLGVVLVNVLLGWTFIGWIVALVWAFTIKD